MTIMLCFGCGKHPSEIREYVGQPDMAPEMLVKVLNTTYDPERNTFFCTGCWLSAGMPEPPVDWDNTINLLEV